MNIVARSKTDGGRTQEINKFNVGKNSYVVQTYS